MPIATGINMKRRAHRGLDHLESRRAVPCHPRGDNGPESSGHPRPRRTQPADLVAHDVVGGPSPAQDQRDEAADHQRAAPTSNATRRRRGSAEGLDGDRVRDAGVAPSRRSHRGRTRCHEDDAVTDAARARRTIATAATAGGRPGRAAAGSPEIAMKGTHSGPTSARATGGRIGGTRARPRRRRSPAANVRRRKTPIAAMQPAEPVVRTAAEHEEADHRERQEQRA